MSINDLLYTSCVRCGRKVWDGDSEPIEGSRQRICIFCLAEKQREEREKDKEINLDNLIWDLPSINKSYSSW